MLLSAPRPVTAMRRGRSLGMQRLRVLVLLEHGEDVRQVGHLIPLAVGHGDTQLLLYPRGDRNQSEGISVIIIQEVPRVGKLGGLHLEFYRYNFADLLVQRGRHLCSLLSHLTSPFPLTWQDSCRKSSSGNKPH